MQIVISKGPMPRTQFSPASRLLVVGKDEPQLEQLCQEQGVADLARVAYSVIGEARGLDLALTLTSLVTYNNSYMSSGFPHL